MARSDGAQRSLARAHARARRAARGDARAIGHRRRRRTHVLELDFVEQDEHLDDELVARDRVGVARRLGLGSAAGLGRRVVALVLEVVGRGEAFMLEVRARQVLMRR